MKPIAIALVLFVSGSSAFAQIVGGTIRGTVRNPDGIVAGASVQAKQLSTGKTFTATYEISVPQLGITSARFVQQDVVVQAGKAMLSICNENNKFESNAGIK